MNIIQQTGILSLIIQIITFFVDSYALSLDIGDSSKILNQLLWVEYVVQIVEGSFYIWLVLQFTKISNITPYRYWDWFITTPTMLFTLCIYMLYLQYKEDVKQNKNLSPEANIQTTETFDNKNKENTNQNEIENNMKYPTIKFYLEQYWKPLLLIIIMDWLMLLFGYLGEINYLSIGLSTILGFIPFVIMFGIIYYHFALKSPKTRNIYWYFVVVWGLYGVAALMPYELKNIMYNILDLFAKNFFGLYLAYLIIKIKNGYPDDD